MGGRGSGAKRTYGTGQVYEKHGAYYGRWRTGDGRKLNRRLGLVREPGSSEGLTRPQAERRFRQLQQDEEVAPRRRADAETVMVAAASASLRRRLAVEGSRKSYLEGYESMERVHVVPRLGASAVFDVTSADVEALASSMLRKGLKPKTVRNVITYLHSVFEHAIGHGWCATNPVRYASRPKRRRAGDVNPDLRFLSVAELEAVLRAIPDAVVVRPPAPTRAGRPGPAPPTSQTCSGRRSGCSCWRRR